MSLLPQLTLSGKPQPLEKFMSLGRWFQYEGNTSFSAVNSLPDETNQFICSKSVIIIFVPINHCRA